MNTINQEGVIDRMSETHYRFHAKIDSGQYPQVHDFYEFVLVTSGILQMEVCGKEMLLSAGNLLLLRPGDVHTKGGENTSHINLAFSHELFSDLMHYLRCRDEYEVFKSLPYVEPVQLTNRDFLLLKGKIQEIGQIPEEQQDRIRTSMRKILFEILSTYLFSNYSEVNHEYENIPEWLAEALNVWQMGENRHQGLDFFCEQTGFSKEHLCRCFKRYLGMSPTAYMNKQRLNYAVDLMGHSDYSMIDIAYEAGFKSSSRFYFVFREEFGMSPKEFMTGKSKRKS